jgi:glycosyltransferase involved in cell wall biosynthesis
MNKSSENSGIVQSDLVSVIIPCYNSEKTIIRAIESAINQTLPPSEIIIVDDASSDRSRSLIIDFIQTQTNHPIKLLTLDKNGGASNARNAAWNCAAGKYLAFLDADDEWHPQKLEVLLDWFGKNADAIFCGHLCAQVEHSGLNVDVQGYRAKRFNLRDMLISNRFSTPAVMILKSIEYRFPTSRRYSEDYELWLKVVAQAGFVDRIELPLAWYFKRPYGESGLSANLCAMEKGELQALWAVRRDGIISSGQWLVFTVISFAKYLKRVLHRSIFSIEEIFLKLVRK